MFRTTRKRSPNASLSFNFQKVLSNASRSLSRVAAINSNQKGFIRIKIASVYHTSEKYFLRALIG